MRKPSHGSFTVEHSTHSLEQNTKIHAQRPVVYVLRVQADHFFKIGDLAAATDLPETGDAGLDGHAGPVVGLISVKLAH